MTFIFHQVPGVNLKCPLRPFLLSLSVLLPVCHVKLPFMSEGEGVGVGEGIASGKAC